MTFLSDAPRVDEPTALELPSLFDPCIVEGDGDAPTFGILVDGHWRPASSGERFEVRSPIDDRVIAHAQRAGHDDVTAAITAAAAARTRIRQLSAADRIAVCAEAAAIVREHAETFTRTIVVDLGKTTASARSETDTTIQRLELVREEVRKIFGEFLPGDWVPGTQGRSGIVLREPHGTVAAIGPFNYPLFTPAAKIIPAIAAGNSAIAKAPSDDPVALLLFARALEEAGLPPGVLNVVTGSGAEVGDVLAGHPDVSMLSFTGSSAAGRQLARAAGPKPIHLELGGNAAGIVLDDAALDVAVAKTVAGAFKNAGQRCSGLSRILVVDGLVDDYLDAAVKEASTWTVGDPRADGVQVGPLVGPAAADRVEGLIDDAVGRGAVRVLGGGRSGSYVEPTVLAGVPVEADIVWEETFGPVLAVVPVADEPEAIAVANRSRYGLDSAVFTRDLERAWRVAGALRVGMVTVNDAPSHGVGHFPFGGRTPDSGVGREGLGYSIDECTALKTVVLPAG